MERSILLRSTVASLFLIAVGILDLRLADATIITQITFDPADDSAPAWSPDGSQFAFVSERSGNRDIWVMEIDGSNPAQLTFNPSNDGSPSWSPDGQWIIFDSDRDGLPEELYRVPSAGGAVVRVTNNSRRELEPFWAPTGSWAVCHSLFNSWDIAIYDAISGALVHQVTSDPAGDFEPGFSPLLDRVVFRSDRTGDGEIFVAPIPAGPATQITFNPGLDLQPSWSESHGLIAFASDMGGPSNPAAPGGPLTDEQLSLLAVDIWITNEIGGGFVRVTDDHLSNHRPRWSPDGRRIVFQSMRTGNWDVFIADDLPIVVPVEEASWGEVKARFVQE